MDVNKLTNLLATLVLSLQQQPNGETRDGIMYAALMPHCSHEEFKVVMYAAERSGLIQRGANFLLRITPKGREMAHKINKALDAIVS